MGIGPAAGIPIGLTPAVPSVLTPTLLQAQLEAIGLSCAQISAENLQQWITEVDEAMPNGSVQSYWIGAPAGSVAPESLPEGIDPVDNGGVLLADTSDLPATQTSAIGNWTESTNAQGFGANLGLIMYPTHFQWLMSQAAEQNFPGVTDGPIPYNGDYANAEAIQTLFENAATTASATVVAGIDQAAMNATFTNVIQPLADASLQNYTQKSWRMILLVENYNTSTGYCDAIGAVSVGWELEITDYQRKSKDGGDTHPTQLKIGAWSALYSDTDTLCSNYSAVCQHFGITPEGCPPTPG